jgi:predicted ATPase
MPSLDTLSVTVGVVGAIVVLLAIGGVQSLLDTLGWRVEKRRLFATLKAREKAAAPRTSISDDKDDGHLTSDAKAPPALYLRTIELTNIRCFRSLKIEFAREETFYLRTTILGDNALGKSTLLRAIGIALSNETDAAALMKSMSGPLIRSGEVEATIYALLIEDQSGARFEIKKTITIETDGSEKLKQVTVPETIFPWSSVFVCGYGTQRTAAANESFDAYSTRLAVATLFDSRAFLQNPELVLLRQNPALKRHLVRKLLDVMLLDPATHSVEESSAGLRLRGPLGSVPFNALSDGYRSTTQWFLDLFAWLILTKRIPAREEPAGILVLDEIEQHLHPRWQRHVIQQLSAKLPRMQIIATTHTPLVASGMADVQAGALLRLLKGDGDEPKVDVVDTTLLHGMRADQVLTEFFDLTTSRNPGSNEDLDRYVQLRSAKSLKPDEKSELEALAKKMQPGLQSGETEFERTVDRAVSDTLDNLLSKEPAVPLDLETKRKLRELFRGDQPQ